MLTACHHASYLASSMMLSTSIADDYPAKAEERYQKKKAIGERRRLAWKLKLKLKLLLVQMNVEEVQGCK